MVRLHGYFYLEKPASSFSTHPGKTSFVLLLQLFDKSRLVLAAIKGLKEISVCSFSQQVALLFSCSLTHMRRGRLIPRSG